MRFAHIGWNLAGLSLPLVVAAATVPRLISILGQERFGLLALAWGLVGYGGPANYSYVVRLSHSSLPSLP